jgi:hypothetical protein
MPIQGADPSTSCASQSACPLFAKLLPELRNRIYGYVFATDESTHKDLATAVSKRPWSNLLLTCQRVFGETNRIYQEARIASWTLSTFYLRRMRTERLTWPIAPHIVNTLHDRELALIRNVTIIADCRNVYRGWRLTASEDSRRGWTATFSCSYSSRNLSLAAKRSGLIQLIDFLS